MPTLSRTQETVIRNALEVLVAPRLIALMNALAPAARVVPPLVNHTPPTYVADTNYSETINGARVTYLTVGAIRSFWEVTLSLLPKHIHALRNEGISHPKDLAKFNSKEFDMVIRSMKGRQAALPGLAQMRLKQACDYFQFLLATDRKMKNQYLTHDSIKSHAIQFQAFKDTDSKEVRGLPKLTESTDVLSWMDRTEKHLWKIPGVDFYPLAYLLRETATAPAMTVDLLPDKCYS